MAFGVRWAKSIDSPTSERVPPRRAVAGYRMSNRLMLGGGALALLLINLTVGLFAREQQHTIIGKAVDVYDTAFVSSNYIHRAQIAFQHFVDDRLHAASAGETFAANAQLNDVLDELDVVIERSSSPPARARAAELRSQIAAISEFEGDSVALAVRLTAAQKAMESLAQRTSALGLHARDEIEELSARSDLLLLGSIATSVMMAGLALVLLRHAVAQSTFARITHMASYDSLTGLPNRIVLRARLTQAANDLRHDYQDVTVEFWDERMATNLRHQFFAIQAVAPMMRDAGGGSIINFGSISWHTSQGGMPAYTTAKAAVEGLTKGMARDLGPFGIRVNCVIPGWVMTERQIKLWLTPEGETNLLQMQCLKQKLVPPDLTRMVL